MPGGRPGRCLGPELSAYADRTLCPAELVVWDRHLVACAACHRAVEDERRMLASLRRASGPEVPSDLRAMLLSLAATDGHGPPPTRRAPGGDTAGPRVPPVPPAPAHRRAPAVWSAPERRPAPPRRPTPPLPTVDRAAPALHRSAVRATVFAGLAAGASAAAAWSFAVVGSPLVPQTPATAVPHQADQRARPAVSSFMKASLGAGTRVVGSATATPTTVVLPSRGPVVSGSRVSSAQSTP